MLCGIRIRSGIGIRLGSGLGLQLGQIAGGVRRLERRAPSRVPALCAQVPRPSPSRRWRQTSESLRPMLATLADAPLTSPRLVYEPKYDGIRGLVEVLPARNGPSVRIWSRLGNEKTTQFPSIVRALETAAAHLRLPLTLDGEIVALDDRGRPAGFQRLQGRIHLKERADVARVDHAQPVALILFDLLRDGDEDVRGLPLVERRKRLEAHFGKLTSETIRLSEQAVGDGRALQARAKAEQWEGLIAKEAQSIYQSGKRSPAWRKLKILQRTGVRGRRMDRTAADAPALRRAAAWACTKVTVDRRPPTADWFMSVTREQASTARSSREYGAC